jgi:hypothetical protein
MVTEHRMGEFRKHHSFGSGNAFTTQNSTCLFLHPVFFIPSLFKMASDQIAPAIMHGMLASVHFKQRHFQFSCALLCHKTTLSKKIDWPKHCYVQWFVIGACLDVCVRFIDTKAGGVGVQCYQGSMSFVISVKELPYLEISVSVCLTQQDSRYRSSFCVLDSAGLQIEAFSGSNSWTLDMTWKYGMCWLGPNLLFS